MKICILGSGAFGLALGSIFHENKQNITFWTNNIEEKNLLNESRISPKLKDYKIPKDIKITTDLKEAVGESNLIVFATPGHAINETSQKLSEFIQKDTNIIIASKGIENETCLFYTDVIKKYIETDKIAVISGPTFAKDIVNHSKVGFSISGHEETIKLAKILMENKNTKLRETDDIIGLEICGAIKNVIAISSGILAGLNISDSTKALFLTEALNDIKYLIKSLSGKEETILSLGGLGDIIMTSSSTNSRNFTYGKLIGEGKIKEAENYKNTNTTEGLYTLKSIKTLLKRQNIKMPIIDLIDDIISNKKDKEELLYFLIDK